MTKPEACHSACQIAEARGAQYACEGECAYAEPTPRCDELQAEFLSYWQRAPQPKEDDDARMNLALHSDKAMKLARTLERDLAAAQAKLAARNQDWADEKTRAETAERALKEAKEQLRIASATVDEEQAIAVQQQNRADAAQSALAEAVHWRGIAEDQRDSARIQRDMALRGAKE